MNVDSLYLFSLQIPFLSYHLKTDIDFIKIFKVLPKKKKLHLVKNLSNIYLLSFNYNLIILVLQYFFKKMDIFMIMYFITLF